MLECKMIQLALLLKIVMSQQTNKQIVCFSPRKSHTLGVVCLFGLFGFVIVVWYLLLLFCFACFVLFFSISMVLLLNEGLFPLPLSYMIKDFSLQCSFHSSLGY